MSDKPVRKNKPKERPVKGTGESVGKTDQKRLKEELLSENVFTEAELKQMEEDGPLSDTTHPEGL